LAQAAVPAEATHAAHEIPLNPVRMITPSYCVWALALPLVCGSLAIDQSLEQEVPANTSKAHLDRFHNYIEKHGRSYQPGSDEYEKRFVLFSERVAKIDTHNSKANQSWSAVVNHLTDRTHEELRKLRGYRHQSRAEQAGGHQAAGFLTQSMRTVDLSHLPASWSWMGLHAMGDVRDQGTCGSCWAFAAATVLRAHSELYQRDRTFSVQQMVSCTPNPNRCGGSGGCEGATAELAMDYVSRMGLSMESDMEYDSRDSKCPFHMQMPKPTLRSLLRTQFSAGVQGNRATQFGMMNWKKLPENRVEPLLLALYDMGPVATSVMASETWNSYGGGVLDSCESDAVINHAVTLVGYGEEQGRKFWQIQNSWGPDWGEKGFLKLLRHKQGDENQYCGWDTQPDLGTGCAGGPPKVYVCGSCGILYDSVVPSFQLSSNGLLARTSREQM